MPPPPFRLFSENSSDFVAGPFPHLRKPMTYDNQSHPSHPSTYSIEDDLSWTKMNWCYIHLRWSCCLDWKHSTYNYWCKLTIFLCYIWSRDMYITTIHCNRCISIRHNVANSHVSGFESFTFQARSRVCRTSKEPQTQTLLTAT